LELREEVSWLALLEPTADNLTALYAQRKEMKAPSTVAIWPQLSGDISAVGINSHPA